MVTADPPGGGTQRDGSVRVSTPEGYRWVICAQPTPSAPPAAGEPRPRLESASRRQHHCRPDPVGIGRLVDGKQTLVGVDESPRTVAGDAEGNAVEGKAASHVSLDLGIDDNMVEVAQCLRRG